MPVRRELLAGPVLEVAPRLLGMVLRRTTDEGTVAVRLTEVEAYDGPNDPGSHAYRGQTARNAVMFGPPGFLYVYFTYGMHFCMNISAGPDGQPSAVLLRAGEVIEGVDLARTRRGRPEPDQTKFNEAAQPDGATSVQSVRTPGTRRVQAADHDGGALPGKRRLVRAADADRDGDVPSGQRRVAASADEDRAGGVLPGKRRPVRTANPDRDLARGPARLCVALGVDREANGTDLLATDSPIQLLPGPGFDGEPATGPRVGLREAADRPWRFWIPDDPTVSPYRPHVPKRRA